MYGGIYCGFFRLGDLLGFWDRSPYGLLAVIDVKLMIITNWFDFPQREAGEFCRIRYELHFILYIIQEPVKDNECSPHRPIYAT